MKYLKDQRGVALVLELVLLAAVLVAAGVGVYAAMHHKSSPVTSKTAATPSRSLSPTPTPDPTANWTKFSSITGKFSLRYNPAWRPYTYGGYAAQTCHQNSADNILDLDTQQSGSTIITGCGGENPGQVHLGSSAGTMNVAASYEGSTPGLYVNTTSTKVTIDHVEGYRYSAVASRDLLGIEKGGTIIEYHFYANGRNYAFGVEQNPSASNVTSDFDLMITNTLKFSS